MGNWLRISPESRLQSWMDPSKGVGVLEDVGHRIDTDKPSRMFAGKARYPSIGAAPFVLLPSACAVLVAGEHEVVNVRRDLAGIWLAVAVSIPER